MGKLAIKKYLTLMSVVVTFLIAILTFMGLYGGNTNPVNSMLDAALCFLLPVLILINILLVIYWAIRLNLFVIVPVIVIGCCWNYIGTFYQFRSEPQITSTPGVTLATYNVRLFNKEVSGYIAYDIKEIMQQNKVDIICMQEYMDQIDKNGSNIHSKFKDTYPYYAKGKDDMVIFSKYPIVTSKSIPFEYTNNSAMWADIKVGNKTIRVFNVHMESTSINRTLRKISKMQNTTTINNEMVYEALLGSYMFGLQVRGGQAILLANEKRESPHPIVLCGDFNDVPYSYTYNTLKGNLEDGFVTAGNGFMSTYKGAKGLMRIDYIFHDKSLKGEKYYKLDVSYSDHNPVFMKLIL